MTGSMRVIAGMALLAATVRAVPVARWENDPNHQDVEAPKVDFKFGNANEDADVRLRLVKLTLVSGGEATQASGTVVKVNPPANGRQGYLWVLTADHNFRFGARPVKASFTFPTAADPITLRSDQVTFGPDDGKVDLAVVRFAVRTLDSLPKDSGGRIVMGIPIKKWSGDGKSIVAICGHGNYATKVDTTFGAAFFKISKGSTKNLRVGSNVIKRAKLFEGDVAGRTYKFQALSSTLRFKDNAKDNAKEVKYVSAGAYFLAGDSGGGTLEKVGDGPWSLIGVHSNSDGKEDRDRVDDGFDQDDVHILGEVEGKAVYKDWLDKALEDPSDPEPLPRPWPVSKYAALLLALSLLRARVR